MPPTLPCHAPLRSRDAYTLARRVYERAFSGGKPHEEQENPGHSRCGPGGTHPCGGYRHGGNREEPGKHSSGTGRLRVPGRVWPPEATGTPAAPSPSASTSPEAPAETELSAPPATPDALPEAVPGIVTGLQCNVAGGTQLFATLQDVWASPDAASDCDAVYGTGQVNAAEGAALAALDPNAQSPFGLTSLYAICASLDDTVLASVSTAYSPSHKTAALSLCPNHPKAALLQG